MTWLGWGVRVACCGLALCAAQRAVAQPAQPDKELETQQESAAPQASPPPGDSAPAAAPEPPPGPQPAAAVQPSAQPGAGSDSAPARSPDQLRAAVLAFLEGQRDPLGRRCDLRAVARLGGVVYAACGEAGVWLLRARATGFVLVERRDVEGSADGFFVQGGHLWVEVTTSTAHKLARAAVPGSAMLAPGAQSSSTTEAAPTVWEAPAGGEAGQAQPQRFFTPSGESAAIARRRGDVVEVAPLHAVVNLGAGDGVQIGTRIAIYRKPSAAKRSRLSDDLVAIGEVDNVSADHARVVLGVGERVEKGASAEISMKPETASSIAPPRSGGLWEVGFVARPFVVLDTLGMGMLNDGRVGYRGEDPFLLEAQLSPLAFASADDGVVTPMAGFVTASYDTRLFEAGLGIGAQTVNNPDFDLESGSGISLVQRLRLGALDGLHLAMISRVVLFHQNFEFSDLKLTLQIPFGGGTWMVLGGGGGLLGAGHGEIGLRTLVSGDAGKDSFFLTAVVGGAHLFEDDNCFDAPGCSEDIDYSGPMVGIGGEWRL